MEGTSPSPPLPVVGSTLPDAPDPAPRDDPSPPEPSLTDPSLAGPLSRRGFLRGAAIAGGGLVAATLASCTPAGAPTWTYGPAASRAPGGSAPPSTVPSTAPSAPASAAASPVASASAAASASVGPTETLPAGWSTHDLEARTVIRRYLGDLVPALKDIYPPAVYAKIGDILGVADGYPELQKKPAFVQVPNLFLSDAVQPLKPTVEGGVKVFDLTVDEITQQIDEMKPPIAALGFNKQWPGPTIRVTQGDKVKAVFTNNLRETTGIHFHGVEFDDFTQDGIPFVTQLPIAPGESYAYEFTAKNAGSLMYHSHHNATDQVGRGLLGAFVVDPVNDPVKYDREYIWISNDVLGGFTINGHGFPATVPLVAAVGETVRVRFMNEGIMMHPWHSHGYTMRVIARDGHPLGSAAFDCDTLGVNPGERWDALITVDRPGIWAFHCHILPHVEGASGMFGMVNTLVVVPEKAHVDAIVKALVS